MRAAVATVLLLGLASVGRAAPEPMKVVPPGERVLQSGIEGISAVLLVEDASGTRPGRMQSDLRGRFRLELGGVVLEVLEGAGYSIDPDTGDQSALAAPVARRLDLHDFLAYALQTRPVLEHLEMVDPQGRQWRGRDADGTTGTVRRDEAGRISGYDVELPDASALEVRFEDWIRFGDFELPSRVRTTDAQGARTWKMSGYREEAMAEVEDGVAKRWLAEDELPAEARAALDAERAFALMARNEGMKAAFLEWIVPQGTVFGPGPMTVESRYAEVPDAKADQPALEWLPEWIVIAGSRELAVISGRWNLTPVGEELPTDFGQYLSIWSRSGERWRVLADIGTDQPEQRPLTPHATGRMIEALAPRIMMVPDPVQLADQVEGEFAKQCFRDGYLATLRDRADRDVIALRVGRVAAMGIDGLTVPAGLEDLAPRIDIEGSAAAAAHDFLAAWGVMHFDGSGDAPERLAFLRVWQLETSRWQIIADVYREMP